MNVLGSLMSQLGAMLASGRRHSRRPRCFGRRRTGGGFMQTVERRRFLTRNEQRATGVLSTVADSHGLQVHAHVKLTHVVNERPPRITDREWQYATRAELDFVVVDRETLEVEFAIELDDLSHVTEHAQRHDRMKDAVCDAADLELLRVEFSSARPEHVGLLDTRKQGRLLVDYLIDARGFMEAFADAQDAGYVPMDEPGDYRSIIDRDDQGCLRFVNDLSNRARLEVLNAYRAGKVAKQTIGCVGWEWRSGVAEAWAWLHVRDQMLLFQRMTLRSYRLDCGITPLELAQDLAAAAIGDHLLALDRGEAVLVKGSDVQRLVEEVRARRNDLMPGPFHVIDHLRFGSS